MASATSSRGSLRASGLRVLGAVTLLVALAATLSWVRSRFEMADHRRAVELVSRHRPHPRGPDLQAALAARHDVEASELRWRSEILSSCHGHVRVYAMVPGAEATTYAFDADLVRPSVHPTDPKTVQLMATLTAEPEGLTPGGGAQELEPR